MSDLNGEIGHSLGGVYQSDAMTNDFVVAIQHDDIIVFGFLASRSAHALRKICNSLRWEIVSDTTPGIVPLDVEIGEAALPALSQ